MHVCLCARESSIFRYQNNLVSVDHDVLNATDLQNTLPQKSVWPEVSFCTKTIVQHNKCLL